MKMSYHNQHDFQTTIDWKLFVATLAIGVYLIPN